jgi:hypothetical protein
VQAWDRAPVISAQAIIPEDVDRPHLGMRSARRQTPGLYLFSKLRTGTHTMTVRAPGFVPLTRQVTVGPTGSTEPLEIILGAGTQLSGRVHFPADIEVYQQTTVTVFGSESNKALGTADVAPDGTYSLAGIPKGSILVRADAPALGRDGATRPALTVARLVPLQVDDGPRVCDLDLVPAVRLEVHFTRASTSTKDAAPPGISAGGLVKSPNALEAFILDAEGRPWKAIDAWRQTLDLPSSGNTDRVWYLPPGRYTVGVRKGDAILCEVRVSAPGTATLALPDP